MIWRHCEWEGPGYWNVSSRLSSRPFRDAAPADDGANDGFPDQLFRFTRLATATSLWRLPVREGHLDPSAVFRPSTTHARRWLLRGPRVDTVLNRHRDTARMVVSRIVEGDDVAP